jgi:hypothetical protein
MANETTSAIQDSYIATSILSQRVMDAEAARFVARGFCAGDVMDGVGAGRKDYLLGAVQGASSAGTEGVDLSPTRQLADGTPVQVTPTEGIADMALITEKTVRRRLGGTAHQSLRSVFESGDKVALSALLAPDVADMTIGALKKYEADGLDTMLNAPSNSVGTTNTDLTILVCISAIRQMKIQQPLRPPTEWAFLMPSAAKLHLDTEVLLTSGVAGGAGGTLWGTLADYQIANRPGDAWVANGFHGTLFGIPWFEYDDEFKETANGTTDVLGILFCLGDPRRAPDAYMKRPPSFVFLEETPLTWRFQMDESLRSMEVIATADYAFADLFDGNHVKFLIDND